MRRPGMIAIACVACSGAGDAPPKEKAAAPALAAAPAPAPAATPDAPSGRDKDPCSGLFDPPPGATRLCQQTVLGTGAEIHWSSWAVTTSRWDTFTLYQERAKGCPDVSSVSKPPLLAVSQGDTRASIHDVTESGYPTCETRPGPDAKTVIVISGKLDRP